MTAWKLRGGGVGLLCLCAWIWTSLVQATPNARKTKAKKAPARKTKAKKPTTPPATKSAATRRAAKKAPKPRPAKRKAPVSRRPSRRPVGRRLTKAQKKRLFRLRFLALRRRILNPKGGLIDKMKLLKPTQLRRFLSFRGKWVPLFLQGIRRSPRYDAVQLVPHKPGKAYVLALQIWLPPRGRLQSQWRGQLRSYPNAQQLQYQRRRGKKRSPVGKAAFSAYRSPLSYLNFIATRKNAIISISCHHNHCTHQQLMINIARSIDQKIR